MASLFARLNPTALTLASILTTVLFEAFSSALS